MPGRLPRAILTAFVVSTLAFSLAACTSTDSPVQSPTPTSAATGTPVPSSTAAPALVQGGTAEQNLPFFDSVNNGVVEAAKTAGGTPDGKGFVSALSDKGFAVADMQVTPDVTTVGVKADTIQFSVSMGGQCLIGQYGFSEYHSLVAPLLGTGKCLIGETRTIDW